MERLKVDTREDDRFVVRLSKEHDIPFDAVALDAGDYLISTEASPILVERSTFTDFVGKIISGRLHKQVEKCKAISDIVIFIIEGHYSKAHTKFSRTAFISTLGSLAMRGVIPICVENSSDTANLISYLYHSIEKTGDQYNPLLQRLKPKDMDNSDRQIFLLTSFAGIGQKKAAKALAQYTIGEIMRMNRDSMVQTFGKPGNKMYEVLNDVE